MNPIKDPEGFEKIILHKFVDFDKAHVLDVGCGDGRLTWKFAAATNRTFGIDPNFDELRLAKADCPADLRERVFLARADANHIPFTKETFNTTILSWSL